MPDNSNNNTRYPMFKSLQDIETDMYEYISDLSAKFFKYPFHSVRTPPLLPSPQDPSSNCNTETVTLTRPT